MDKRLSEKWIKASIAGTMWAASEIVLGSFLHNLKVPFSGNILTAIGLIILISIGHIWNERGIFWRAGLICAIMKTMSPSAVIFGPMIAIFAESLLLEASVLVLGRNMAGFALGAMLAMSWNLFHKIVSYIFYYGSNIIEVYANLLEMARRQLRIETEIVWLPILVLLASYALFGLFAAVIGIRVGKRMVEDPVIPAGKVLKDASKNFIKGTNENFNYSVKWLVLDIILIISSFLILSYTPWYVWMTSVIIIVTIWLLRYRRALRQLSRPKFWILFVFITLVTAFVFTRAGNVQDFWRHGLLTGIQMNFRAVIIIVGFSALGTELYNPLVRSFFQRTSFRNLPLAVELSVESLPAFIAAIPDFKSLVRNPVSIFHQVLSHAENRFSEIKGSKRGIFIITGQRAQGKTTYAINLVKLLRQMHIRVAGFFSIRLMDGEVTTGYDLEDADTGKRERLLGTGEEGGVGRIGKFTICEEGFSSGLKILHSQLHGRNGLVLIDEVGMLEIGGGGWSEMLDLLIAKSHNHLLLIVRDEFIEQVIEKFGLQDPIFLDINIVTPDQAAGIIKRHLP
jgi:nucleoside-triphosphatase THEP1